MLTRMVPVRARKKSRWQENPDPFQCFITTDFPFISKHHSWHIWWIITHIKALLHAGGVGFSHWGLFTRCIWKEIEPGSPGKYRCSDPALVLRHSLIPMRQNEDSDKAKLTETKSPSLDFSWMNPDEGKSQGNNSPPALPIPSSWEPHQTSYIE